MSRRDVATEHVSLGRDAREEAAEQTTPPPEPDPASTLEGARDEHPAEREPSESEEDAGPNDLQRLQDAIERFRPDTVLVVGDDRLVAEAAARGKARGCKVVALLRGFGHRDPAAFAGADALFAASRFAATYYHELLGRPCTVLPPLVDPDLFRVDLQGPGYVTFVDPTPARGAMAFARIADELGRRRPDIPLLIVEGAATAEAVARSGLDLRVHGNLNVVAASPDAKRHWCMTRVCLMPLLGWEDPPLTAVEALINGVPVVASDRGTLPETLGEAGLILPLPDRLTPATTEVPTAEEVAPWVDAVIRLWDDEALRQAVRRKSWIEAGRFTPEIVEPQYLLALDDLDDAPAPNYAPPPGRSRAVVLVPFLDHIEWECEQALKALEQAGVRVIYSRGSSQIDIARNKLASQALLSGAETLLFIDADIGFDPRDALRLLARPEPVLAGIYPKKARLELSSQFAASVEGVVFGRESEGLYPLRYAATGFLKIRVDVLKRMIQELNLPHCDTRWGAGIWPFFQPLIIPHDDGPGFHYLGEDWAFSHRLAQIGITPLADTSIRLWHFGRHSYGWEDAAVPRNRFFSFPYRLR